jgi:hypothetical protein
MINCKCKRRRRGKKNLKSKDERRKNATRTSIMHRTRVSVVMSMQRK